MIELKRDGAMASKDKEKKALPGWRTMHADTDTWAEEIQLKFFREAPPWRKLEMAGQLTQGMMTLAESGLKSRHPQASPLELRRRLADMLLGPELANRVYGELKEACDHS